MTIILTYPLVFHLTTAVPNDIGDPLLNTWILAWDSHALLTDPFNLFNANIFYPLPNTLAYSEHLFSTALLALPLQVVTGEPIVAYNLSLMAAFPLAAFGMYLLLLRWTRRRSAAFVAGLIFAFAPYRFAAIAHLQLLTFQWLPLALLFLELGLNPADRKDDNADTENAGLPSPVPRPGSRLRSQVSRRFSVAFALFLLIQILASWYLAVYSLLIVSLYVLAGLLAGSLRVTRLPRLVAAGLGVLLLTLPFALPYLALFDELQQARPLFLALPLAAVPADFVAAAPFNQIFGALTQPFRTRPGFTEENMLFLGLIGPVLALVPVLMMIKYGLLRVTYFVSTIKSQTSQSSQGVRRPLLFAPDFALYALGTVFFFSLALTFPGPYRFLAHLVPPSTIVRVPPRWILPALFALSALAGVGYAVIEARLARDREQTKTRGPHHKLALPPKSALLLAFCTLFFLAETVSIPLPLAAVENQNRLNPAYHWLAGQADPFALVELPLYGDDLPEFPEVKRIYASTLAWWPLVNGYSGYTPPRQRHLATTLNQFPSEQSITALQTLAALPAPSPLSHLRTQESPTPVAHSQFPPLRAQPPILTSQSLPLLLLIHPGESPLNRSHWETVTRWQVERNPALYPLGQFAGDYLYQVLPPDPDRFSGPPLATFGPQQKIRLLALNTAKTTPALSGQPPLDPSPSHPSQLTLYWQSATPLDTAYTVFIHLRTAAGYIHSQADGPPVRGHYPTTAWQSGEIVQDLHPLPATDSSQFDHLAVGLYDPATGDRLPAYSPEGARLPEDAFIIPLPQ